MQSNQTPAPVFARACGIELSSPKQVGVAFSLVDGATDATVDSFIGFLGGKTPDYATFEACRLAWREGYAEQKPGLVADSYDKAWSRFMARLQEYGEVVKPKAPTKEATKKREQREAGKAATADYKSADEAREAGKAKLEKAATMTAGKEREDMMRAAVSAERAARKFDEAAEREAKAQREQVLKNRKDTLRTFLKDADGAALAILEAAADLANASTSPEARAAAWAVLTAIAPKAGKAADKARKAA